MPYEAEFKVKQFYDGYRRTMVPIPKTNIITILGTGKNTIKFMVGEKPYSIKKELIEIKRVIK